MKIEIGGGTNRRPGYANLDPMHGDEGLRCRVQDGIPLPDNSCEAAFASHILEHIPQGNERIKALNEVHRVLVPGGIFEIIVPLVGYTDGGGAGHLVQGWQPYADPTHVSFWWFPESLLYVCEGPFKPHADYGISIWHLVSHEVRSGWEGHATMRKPA